MASNRSANHRSGLSARCGLLPRRLDCIVVVLVLSLGRSGFDMPLTLVPEREIDPVEQKDSESEEELAIHRRGVFRHRLLEHAWSATAYLMFQVPAGDTSCRAVDPHGRASPHDFDLRNGLGAALRC